MPVVQNPSITSFALQYNNVNFNAVAVSEFDMFITEGDPMNSAGLTETLTDGQVATLTSQGRAIIGYVNVSAVDDLRYYWNATWTNNGFDTGTPVTTAPTWLQGAIPLDFTFDGNQDSLIVNYWDPAWQALVIEQAVDLVARGYTGVFLDDVGRYFQVGSATGNMQLAADRMIDLIGAVHDAITAVNPNATVIINADPYLITNNSAGGNGDQRLLDSVDYHLLENQTTAVADYALSQMPNETLLLLQSVTPSPMTDAQGWARGILYNAPSPAYDVLGALTFSGATENGEQIRGTNDANLLFGLGGNDVIRSYAGDDILNGNDGNDFLDGGLGNDFMRGGSGDDRYVVNSVNDTVLEDAGEGLDTIYASIDYVLPTNVEILRLSGLGFRTGIGNGTANQLYASADGSVLYGLNGNDKLYGGRGNDSLQGGGGNDALNGGDGDDTLFGGAGRDVLVGGGGSDLFIFEDGHFAGMTLATADRVRDFQHGIDRIDLTYVDADTGTQWDQAFTFIGSAAFSGVAGQLRYQVISNATFVSGDVDGDGQADFTIAFDGVHSFVFDDFYL